VKDPAKVAAFVEAVNATALHEVAP
jgi:hypothetical protein